MSSRTEKKVFGIIRIIVLVVFMLGVILPLYWMIITAFKTTPEIIDTQNITYYPHKVTLGNFVEIFKAYDYGHLLYNSVVVSVSTAVAVTILSLFGGYGLTRFKFKGKNLTIIGFLVTQMIPGILVIIPLYVVLSKVRLLNTHIGLFVYYLAANLPFCIITMRSFFERIPYTLEEAAQVDGCSRLKGLFKIIIPIMFPGIIAVFVFAFIGAWNELIAGTILINSHDMWTIPIGLKSMIGKYEIKWGTLMAGGVLALLPTAVVFAIMQKYVVEGLTSGAVKE